MTIRSAQDETVLLLKTLYDAREAANIADWVMEHLTGKKKVDRLIAKDQTLTSRQLEDLKRFQTALLDNQPVQYVLGEAWFAGMRFFVNEHVLIPRPETEELTDWVVNSIQKTKGKRQEILDIGTGSGCIAVSLKKKLPDLKVTAIDISDEALFVASRNAGTLGTDINFCNIDILNRDISKSLPLFDIIVSNPPYIKEHERAGMANNVLLFEPSTALFVPDNDPLLFYREIAVFAQTHLAEQGSVFLEINEALGKETEDLYRSFGYTTELRKDLQGRNRMVRASKDQNNFSNIDQ